MSVTKTSVCGLLKANERDRLKSVLQLIRCAELYLAPIA
jgi:hypothetical protein